MPTSEATAGLRVLRPGLHTLVVDHGRPRCRSLGVPVGGAADRFSLAVGNALVGNPPDAAALEISLAGPTLRASGELACVVYGAPFDLASDRQALTAGTTFTLRDGEELRIGGAASGARAYLCVQGGLQTPVVLGSRSALEPLRAGDELPCLRGTIRGRFVRIERDWEAPHEHGAAVTLRALEGAQAAWFDGAALYGPMTFAVAPASNRMGLRLAGPPLPVPGRELLSEPVCPGTVQVTRDGGCIVLGVDGQTIGGYPKVAQVIAADLDALGQLRPGGRVRFVRVTLDEAERLYRRRAEVLREWLARLRTAGPPLPCL
jgi:antagonist of KipI